MGEIADIIGKMQFKREQLFGYKVQEVDKFLYELIQSVEKIEAQNIELKEKNEYLEKNKNPLSLRKVENNKDEKSIENMIKEIRKKEATLSQWEIYLKNSIQNAENHAYEIVEEAKTKAKKIMDNAYQERERYIKNAESEAIGIVNSAQEMENKQRDKWDQLQKIEINIISQLKSMAVDISEKAASLEGAG